MMKKNILLALGIAGIMLGCSDKSRSPEDKAQVSTGSAGSTPSFVIDSAPNFIYLKNQGFSVSKDSPYDIVYYTGNYYIYNNTHWYRSSDYHGPWILIQDSWLPPQIGRYSWEDIKKYRDSASSSNVSLNSKNQRDDDNRRRILDQRNEVSHRIVQDQPNDDADNRYGRPSFLIDSPPSFVYLRDQGFSVSRGSSYDIVYYGDSYYVRNNDRWYRSSDYRGPWNFIQEDRLPSRLRKHTSDDLRRYRDSEFRRSDSRNNQYQRDDDNKRRILDQRNDANNRNLQDQQNKAAENKRNQDQQNKAAENKRNQDQQNKVVENKKTPAQQNKAAENSKKQGGDDKAKDNKKGE